MSSLVQRAQNLPSTLRTAFHTHRETIWKVSIAVLVVLAIIALCVGFGIGIHHLYTSNNAPGFLKAIIEIIFNPPPPS